MHIIIFNVIFVTPAREAVHRPLGREVNIAAQDAKSCFADRCDKKYSFCHGRKGPLSLGYTIALETTLSGPLDRCFSCQRPPREVALRDLDTKHENSLNPVYILP